MPRESQRRAWIGTTASLTLRGAAAALGGEVADIVGRVGAGAGRLGGDPVLQVLLSAMQVLSHGMPRTQSRSAAKSREDIM